MPESRIKNTKRNMIFSYLETFITLFFAFVSRTMIIHIFGDEYLGLSSLFTSVLQVLNMAELGFSGAIVYNMYKPVAEGDTDKVCALLAYYKKVYRIIGSIIFAVGIILTPFLPVLIKGNVPDGINIYVLYFLYLINTGISYFAFAYKTALLNALQRLDLTKIAYSVVSILQHVIQIVVLLVFKNYYLFFTINIFGTAAKNIFSAWIANKKYPQYQCKGSVNNETKKDIISRVKGLLVCNISMITYTTLDSIILSSFIGLTAVAIYNNYMVIFTNMSNLIVMIRNAMQVSVGNSIVKETKEKNYQDMLLWQFLFAVLATWFVTCLLSIYQPFMRMWMGEERLLSIIDVVILCLWFFVTVISQSFFLYLSGRGLWWEVRWVYISSTVCNLLLNILLAKLIGVTGVLLSSLIATFVFNLWQCRIILKEYFNKSIGQFLGKYFFYFIVCIISAFVAYIINQNIPDNGIFGLIIRAIICTVVSLAIMLAIYNKLEIFSLAKAFVKKTVNFRFHHKKVAEE